MFLLRRALGIPPQRDHSQTPVPLPRHETDEFPDDPDTDMGDSETDADRPSS